MMFNIMKKKEDETYCYIGKNRTEVSEYYLAVKLSEREARNYANVLSRESRDEGNYILVEAN